MNNLAADVQAPNRTPGRSSGRSGMSSAATTSKLRDSCHACAMSKVKCPKEKPVCSRCKTRGTACQYFFTKRPGRRRESSINRDSSRNNNTASSGIESRIRPRPRSESISNSDTDTDAAACSTDIEKEDMSYETTQPVQNSLRDLFLPANFTSNGSVSRSKGYLGTPTTNVTTSPKPRVAAVPEPTDLFSPLEEQNILPDLLYFDPNIEDMDLAIPDIDPSFGLHTLVGNDYLAHAQSDTASLLMPPDSINVDTSPVESSQTTDSLDPNEPSKISSFGFDAHSLSESERTAPIARNGDVPVCGCLARALGLLKMLSTPRRTSPRSSIFLTREMFANTPEFASTLGVAVSSPGASARTVTLLSENQQSIDVVNSMLSCPACADDAFFLTVLSMIVLKMLERYSAAATSSQVQGAAKAGVEGIAEGAATAKSANSTVIGSKDPMRVLSCTSGVPHDTRSFGRTRAQLVLGELHRVQRLVNQLSPKLKRLEHGVCSHNPNLGLDLLSYVESGSGSSSGSSNSSGALTRDGDGAKVAVASFSASTLERIESDIRKCLSVLSADIINRLRQS